jgi:hypothetical protein
VTRQTKLCVLALIGIALTLSATIGRSQEPSKSSSAGGATSSDVPKILKQLQSLFQRHQHRLSVDSVQQCNNGSNPTITAGSCQTTIHIYLFKLE